MRKSQQENAAEIGERDEMQGAPRATTETYLTDRRGRERGATKQIARAGIYPAFFTQRGGTILGFIAGLIVGLVIAVIVAIVVTKSSAPFSNKQGNQGKISEPTAVQAVDPNKPLYGNRDAAKEAAKSFSKEDEPKTDATTGVKIDGKTRAVEEPKKETRAEPKKDVKLDDRLAEKQKKAEAAKEAAKNDAADDKWTYYLQTSAFRVAADAESARARLALSGFEARVSETSTQGSPLYRVRMGPFSSIETMNRVRSRLSDNGVDAAVVRVPK
jgi:cell division protein FtsN